MVHKVVDFLKTKIFGRQSSFSDSELFLFLVENGFKKGQKPY
jgi:hypothetical protein